MININHLTYNTRHNHVFAEKDISPEMIFLMKDYIKNVTANKRAKLIDGVEFDLTYEKDAGIYMSTLYYADAPFLVTAGTREKSSYLWKIITRMVESVYPQNTFPTLLEPQAPYIIDVLMPIYAPISIYSWTGDFCQCLFWYLLLDTKEKGL